MDGNPMDMTEFTMSTTVTTPYDATVARVRDLLGDAGFGVLTEIDLQATMRAKLGVEVPAQVILGACRPELAHRALQVDPRIATLLPCNVVVTQVEASRSRVEVFDPAFMAMIAPDPELEAVAADARTRLSAMMGTLMIEAGEKSAVGA